MKAILQAGGYREQMPVPPEKRFIGSFIDLFCGCGGFTLGMQRAGFQCLAAIDFNAEAVATFQANFPEVKHALERDLTAFKPAELAQLIGADHVDVIVGGPPVRDSPQLVSVFDHQRQ